MAIASRATKTLKLSNNSGKYVTYSELVKFMELLEQEDPDPDLHVTVESFMSREIRETSSCSLTATVEV